MLRKFFDHHPAMPEWVFKNLGVEKEKGRLITNERRFTLQGSYFDTTSIHMGTACSVVDCFAGFGVLPKKRIPFLRDWIDFDNPTVCF
jgi:hypothetical protein